MKKSIRFLLAILIICVTVNGFSSCNEEESGIDDKPVSVKATVVEIEKYGHAVLDVNTADLVAVGFALGDVVCVRLGAFESTMPFFDGYYSNPGSLLLRGSAPEARVAICINYDNFAAVNGVRVGDSVEITMAEKAGMLAIQELCALHYSNDREDYADDATFSNFRAVTLGRIGEGKLYRTASPINNEHGRAEYADNLIESVGVATVLNLADSFEDIEGYLANTEQTSEYYRSLYESGRVIAIDLAGDFFSNDFAATIADGLTFLARNETPFCIHCTEGKDRAGFTAMLLEALMGATLDQIIYDYTLTFYNYYGIDKDREPERYQAVLDTNLIPIILHVTDAKSVEELKCMDLEVAVTEYLLEAGMTEEDISMLKDKLS